MIGITGGFGLWINLSLNYCKEFVKIMILDYEMEQRNWVRGFRVLNGST